MGFIKGDTRSLDSSSNEVQYDMGNCLGNPPNFASCRHAPRLVFPFSTAT